MVLSFVVDTADNVTRSRHTAFPDGGMGLAVIGVAAFSLSVPMTKLAVRDLDPDVAGVGRAVVAAALAAVVLVVRRVPVPARRQLARLGAVVGGVVVGFPLLVAIAVRDVPSSHGAVVIGLLPLATAGGALLRAGERPSAGYWASSLVGVAAVVAYALHEGGRSLHAADLLLLGAVVAAGVGYTEGAMLARELGAWQVICWALVLATPATVAITAVAAAGSGLDASPTAWAGFAYTAVVSMFLGFFAWYAGLARAGIARAGQVQLLQPGLSLLWAWPLLGEPLTVPAVAATALVVGAVVVGRRFATVGSVRAATTPSARGARRPTPAPTGAPVPATRP